MSPVGSEDKGGDDDEAEEEEEAAAEGEPVANKKARIDLETLPSPQNNIDLKVGACGFFFCQLHNKS